MNSVYALAYFVGLAAASGGAFFCGGFPAVFVAIGAGMMLGVVADRLGDISRKISGNSEPSS